LEVVAAVVEFRRFLLLPHRCQPLAESGRAALGKKAFDI
jgi:hypothetical protein